MPSFFQQILPAAGRIMQYDQAQEERQVKLEGERATNELRQQQVANAKMENAAQLQQMESRKALAANVAAEMAKDKEGMADPEKAAKFFEQQAVEAFGLNDFEGGKLMQEEAAKHRKAAADASKATAEKVKALNESRATAALDFEADPTPENGNRLVDAAVKAGVPLAQIPLANPEKFVQWAKAQQAVSTSAENRLEAKTKAEQRAADLEERKREAKAREARDAERDRDAAAARRESNAIRRLLAASTIAARQDKAAARADGTDRKLTKSEIEAEDKKIATSLQITRQMDLMGAFLPGQTMGMFANLKPGADIAESLRLVAGNKLTNAQKQVMQTASQGAGQTMGRMVQAFEGGRAATDSAMKKYEQSIAPAEGDTELTALFKLINTKEEVATFLKGARKFHDPKQQKLAEEMLAQLTPPGQITGKQIIEAARTRGDAAELTRLTKASKSMADAAAEVFGKKQEAAAGAADKRPADIQEILKKAGVK